MSTVEAGMSRHEFSVAYDSLERRDTHSMDVHTLAPALLAFGRLIREANTEFNGKSATARVLVASDFERKCFNVNFEVVLSFYEQLKQLVASSDVVAAKDILDWLGLLGKVTGGALGIGGLSYLGFLRWKRGRKVIEAKPLTDKDRSGIVEVHVEGDSNSVHVHNHVYNLSENPKALRATRDAFLPLGQDGFDVLRLKEGDATLDEIDPPDVESIVASCNVGIEQAKETQPEVEITPAWLSIYSPVFDSTADKWRFRLGREVIYADISDTKIADEAIARGGVGVDDAYQVKLEITTLIDAQGHKKDPLYKIIEVLKFVQGSRQANAPQNRRPVSSSVRE